MSARKKRPVMYEVIGRGRRARSRPSSWRAGPSHAPASAPPPGAEPPPTPPPVAAPTAVARPPHPRPAPPRAEPAAPTGGASLARYADGRLYLTLPWPYLAVAAVLVLALLVSVYAAGRRSALPAQPQTLEQTGLATREPTEPPVETTPPSVDPHHRLARDEIRTPPTPADDAASRSPATPTRNESPPAESPVALEPGYYYVLVQYFRKSDQDHARAASEFLRANGVPCAVVAAERDLRLYVTQPFDSVRATREMTARIRSLGQEYSKQGGGYSFDQPQIHKK